MNDYPRLNLLVEHGFVDFKVDYEGLFLNFRSQTEIFNVDEVVIFKLNKENNSNHRQEYTCKIKYCNKNNALLSVKTFRRLVEVVFFNKSVITL